MHRKDVSLLRRQQVADLVCAIIVLLNISISTPLRLGQDASQLIQSSNLLLVLFRLWSRVRRHGLLQEMKVVEKYGWLM